MPDGLSGIRVLEHSVGVAAPDVGVMMGSLGAEVIKIEDPAGGDIFRGAMKLGGLIPVEGPGGRSLYFEALNCNKKSVAIDLKKQKGKEILHQLVGVSDVYLTNYRVGAVHRLGLDYETLRQYNPRLIYCELTGYGSNGPDRDLPAYDQAAQARSGIMMVEKSPGDLPYSPPGIADLSNTLSAFAGIALALFMRERFGIGQKVESSLLGTMTQLLKQQLIVSLLAGQEWKPFDRRKAGNPLQNMYQAGDGKWLFTAMGFTADRYWPAFCRALGLGHLEKDPRYMDLSHREEHREELIRLFDQAFAKYPREYWLKAFREADLIAAPINTVAEMVRDPQVLENGYLEEFDHPVLGKVQVASTPFKLSEAPARMRSPAPELGQHTEEVLIDLCHYTWDDITRLKDEGVIL
ncbi:MAG: CoA transferase [Chloroflexi bacterium]|nr:CoA transferase [Chloroflexota bacterium]